MNIKKSTSIGVWLIALGLVTIAASQVWFQLHMSPNGDTVTISEFDGFTTYSYISAILLASLAAVFVISFVASLAHKVISILALALTGFGLAMLTRGVAAQDVSGLTDQIEQATGIAANHGLTGIEISTTIWPWLAIASFVLLLLANIMVLVSERRWPARVAKIDRQQRNNKTPSDNISLWDSQR